MTTWKHRYDTPDRLKVRECFDCGVKRKTITKNRYKYQLSKTNEWVDDCPSCNPRHYKGASK